MTVMMRAFSRREAEGRLVTKCRRLYNPSSSAVSFLVGKALGALKPTPSGLVEAESLEKAERFLEASIDETSRRQKERDHSWGRDPVRKDATGAGSAATTGVSNGGMPGDVDVVWVGDPDQYEIEEVQLAVVEIARMAADRFELPFTYDEALDIIRVAGNVQSEQVYSADDQRYRPALTKAYKTRLVEAYAKARDGRDFRKAMGDTSFAAESSNGAGSPVPTSSWDLKPTATIVPLRGVLAPTGGSTADYLARFSTATDASAAPTPQAPTQPVDSGAGLSVTIDVVALAAQLAAQGYAVDAETLEKAVKAPGIVRSGKGTDVSIDVRAIADHLMTSAFTVVAPEALAKAVKVKGVVRSARRAAR